MTYAPTSAPPGGRRLAHLSLATLGVVYGDIGTSPLYAMRECFTGGHAVAANPTNVLGVLSLIFWSLIVVISVKYLLFILRADNRGEGGILALTALLSPGAAPVRRRGAAVIALGLFGAALLYGDGIITPAISVLSAMEGLTLATPAFGPYVIPLTVAVLVGLFLIQRRGTAGVGTLFGPVTLLWFLVMAGLGVRQLLGAPAVLAAVDPAHGVAFFLHNGWHGFLILGTVFLVVTGGEALYADMGHFGPRPIRLAWFSVVLPALLLNYFGQGAYLLGHPRATHPFYQMAPGWALVPLILLATAATVIASQAVISGAYSLTMQAVQLGFSPRLTILHTSATEKGQIYMPGVNWALMAGCIALVLGFRSSSNLAAAYGIAVTTTMVITTVLFYGVARYRWQWRPAAALAVCGIFLIPDASFFLANLAKVLHGGWLPLVIAFLIFTLMSTWKTGRKYLGERLRRNAIPLEDFLQAISINPPLRVPGTAVFMSGAADVTPSALLHNLKHNRVLHERCLVLTVLTEEVPHVPEERRWEAKALDAGMYRMTLRYGFMDEPDVPQALSQVRMEGWEFKPMETTYFLGRETLLRSQRLGLAPWRRQLFIWMSRNARSATAFFGLPPNRVVELGMQVEI